MKIELSEKNIEINIIEIISDFVSLLLTISLMFSILLFLISFEINETKLNVS